MKHDCFIFKLPGNDTDLWWGLFFACHLKEYLCRFFPTGSQIFQDFPDFFFLPCADVAGLCPGSNVYTAQTDLLHWRRETFRWTVGGLLFTLVILHPYFIFSYCAASLPFRDLFIFCELFFFFFPSHEWLSHWCCLAACQFSWMTRTQTFLPSTWFVSGARGKW